MAVCGCCLPVEVPDSQLCEGWLVEGCDFEIVGMGCSTVQGVLGLVGLLGLTARCFAFPRLRDDVKREIDIEGAKSRMGWDSTAGGVIGVHVRRGDSCHTSLRAMKCVGVREHVGRVRLMASRYKVSRVFVATDSPGVLEDMQARASPMVSPT